MEQAGGQEMKLSDRYDGGDSPFEGDRTLVWRSLPANARVMKASVKLTTARSATGELFEEIIAFTNGQGDWGATKTIGTGFVEVDFHKRRTLARVMGTGAVGANLQVDLGGGAYVEINDKGAIRAPDDTLFTVPADGKLPGLLVTKFKLTAASPNVSQVTIRSAPANVSVRLGNLPPFWTHLGELTTDDASPDFAAVLQAFLADAKAENGFYHVPLILHSDTIARLQVALNIEYQVEASVMPSGLDEVQLPYDFGSLPKAQENVLQLAAPANMRVAPNGVTARVRGAFEESRIVFGPTGAVTPAGTVEISPALSQAQMISIPETLKAAAFDLLMTVKQTAKLQLDLREDLDGKPGNVSLLPGAVKLELPAPVGTPQDSKAAAPPHWVSVALPAEFQFHKDKRYWLVLQSIEGQAAWSVISTPAGSAGMQHTKDGGLSWRDTTVTDISGPTSALFRLRQKPERFETPIELQVGSGEQAIRVSLDRFQPLGRVDFALDFDEIGEAFNQYLDKASPSACPETEHLVNGDFEQWLRVGEKLGAPTANPLRGGASPTMAAISPDGRLAYVGSDDVMQLVDVACNTVLDEAFDISGVPNALVFHPAGGRAYLLGFDRLQVIDTDARKILGDTISLKGGANALALSPDGSQLYVTEYEEETAGQNRGWVRAIDTKLLEQVIQGQLTLAKAAVATHSFMQLNQEPSALAVSPDGNRLYVTIVKHDANDGGEIRIFETATLQQLGAAIPVGQGSEAIALTPDGKWAMVANAGSNTVSLIDTKALTVAGNVELNHTPSALAIAPDGTKAYVASGDSNSGSIIDLAKRSVIETLDAKAPQTAISLTPQGDRIYVITTDGENNSLASIQIGARLPVEWNLTAGQVTPFCLPDPFHLVAVLGERSGRKDANPSPSALSQTVPVAESCLYDLSFRGIATDSDALAEVLWIGKDCGLLRMDQIPIQALEPSFVNVSTLTHARAAAIQQPFLKPHRARLLAPAGAEQAEVRFSTPAGVQAAIDLVSLIATTEAVANADLSLRQEGQLAGWNLLSTTVSGVTVVAVEGGIQLRNSGAETAALVQAIPVKGDQPFNLEFRGHAITQPSAKDNPRIELRWFKPDQSPAGSPVILEVPPTGFDSAHASGVSPTGASEAELHLAAPPGTILEVTRVSLRFSAATSVPVTFIAQAPGELTVSNWRVAFEQNGAEAPRIPEKGLCTPTPPGRQPGETRKDCCFCPCCESEQTMTETTPMETRDGRPALVGHCLRCGTELVRFGGQRISSAQPFSLQRASFRSPIVLTKSRARA
jgi:YVTN family beta-propeller protein